MADVFISYKREDRCRAEKLALALEQNALAVWWDKDLQVGDDYRAKIADELDRASCVIVLWSLRSVAPGTFVMSEANRAHKRGVLLPVRIDKVEPPLGLDQVQDFDLAQWSGDERHGVFQGLLRSLSVRLGRAFTAIESEKRALLVAVDTYDHPDEFPVEGAPMAGAEALARAMSAGEGARFKTVVERNPDIQRLDRSLRALTQQTAANDLVVLYFAGHARLSPDEGLCLCVKDSEPDQLDRTSVPLTWLALKILNRVAAERVIVILDCDFSSRGAALDVETAVKDALGRGKGKHVIVTRTDLTSAPVANRGVFVRKLADGLDQFGADQNRDNVITLDEWFEFAYRSAAAAGAPKPVTWAFDVPVPASALEIARRAAAPAVAVRTPASAATIRLDFLDRVQSRLRSNKIIPVLGDGVYGTGPLSSFQIVGALARRSRALKSGETVPLATAAEYYLGTNDYERTQFLADFRKILEEQATRCEQKLVHSFVFGLKGPWLAISSTYDWFLEQRLAEAGRRFVVVAHVLRSRADRLDGQVAVVRFGQGEPAPGTDGLMARPRFETCPADKLLLDESNDCVVYKMLGSPFLEDYAPTDDQIDTVVVTETDHTLFLARLENQAMRVPTAFTGPLQMRHLLFLGYNLDVWHYRLVSHVFSKDGPASIYKQPLAVRQPTSVMEESFWRRLDADLVPADPESFVAALQSQTG